MRDINRKLPPVPVSTFAMVPRADVPRSRFKTVHSYKTTFDAGVLVPFFVEEVLPGDSFQGDVTMFARMATPIFPIMDNLHLETFFFFCPNRILWANWVKFMGEQDNPSDSINFLVPQVTAAATNGFVPGGVADYFGLPVQNTLVTATLSVNALPFRAYNMIFNEWFRDENLVNSAPEFTTDASQSENQYAIRRRGKRHDYFTSALPWPLKGGVSVSLPMAGNAIVRTNATEQVTTAAPALRLRNAAGNIVAGNFPLNNEAGFLFRGATSVAAGAEGMFPTNLVADLSTATGATINAMRLAVASQQFLEKDARGGTRYAELLRNHFGVTPQDFRLQRPEYIGGGSSMFQTQAIPQTSATGLTGGTTVIGSLGGTTVGTGTHRFSYSAMEHGFIIGILNVRADITYQQGVHRMFTRQTRFDYYWPTFAFLGEQAIRQDEIYATGVPAADTAVFGYQERWSEYRYRPSRITGKFRSYPTAGTLDAWHLAQAFATPPALNATFIEDVSDATVRRVVAAGSAANGQQFLLDSVWHISATRALPARSVPGLTRF
jgi:hypothetical protein